MARQIIGVYNSPDEAINVVEALRNRGFSKEDIHLVANESIVREIPFDENTTIEDTSTSQQDVSLWDQIRGAFTVQDEQAHASETPADPFYGYENEVRDGAILVLVDTDQEIDAAELTRADASRTADSDQSIQLTGEKLNVDKEEVESGEVNISKRTVDETETIDVPVSHEEIVIERKPVKDGQVADDSANNLKDGEEIRIPISEERVNVDKERVVTEEVDVSKNVVTEEEHISENLTREELDVDAEGNTRVKDTSVERDNKNNR